VKLPVAFMVRAAWAAALLRTALFLEGSRAKMPPQRASD